MSFVRRSANSTAHNLVTIINRSNRVVWVSSRLCICNQILLKDISMSFVIVLLIIWLQ